MKRSAMSRVLLALLLLGFDAVGGNSLDNVSDRDFAIEFCAAASIAEMWCSS